MSPTDRQVLPEFPVFDQLSERARERLLRLGQRRLGLFGGGPDFGDLRFRKGLQDCLHQRMACGLGLEGDRLGIAGLGNGLGPARIYDRHGPAVAGPSLKACAEALGEVAGGAGGWLKLDAPRLIAGKADAGFDLDQQLHIPVGADQFDHIIEAGIAGEGIGGEGDRGLRAMGRGASGAAVGRRGRSRAGMGRAAAGLRGASAATGAGRRGRGVLQLADKLIWCRQVGHMGEPDHRHLGSHHRVGREGNLFQSL